MSLRSPHIAGTMARDQTLEIRLSADEKAVIRAAAANDQRTVSDWVRIILVRAAQQRQAAE